LKDVKRRKLYFFLFDTRLCWKPSSIVCGHVGIATGYRIPGIIA